MNEAVGMGKQLYDLFRGNGQVVSIYFVILFVLIMLSKNKRLRHFVLYPSVVILLIAWNPRINEKMAYPGYFNPERYVRIYWLLPIAVTVSYGAVKLIKHFDGGKRLLAALAVAGVMALVGDYMFTSVNYSIATNAYKLPDGVPEVADTIREDAAASGIAPDEVRVVPSRGLAVYIRQYAAEFTTAYGRNGYGASGPLWDLMGPDELNMGEIGINARSGGWQYVVVENWRPQVGSIEESGYSLLADVKGYFIYKDVLTSP